MNTIRKANEHARKPLRPVVSKAGRRVLKWLAKYGERYVHEVCVRKPTLRALHDRGLIYKIHDQDGVHLVGISVAGRKYLEETQ